MFKLIEKNQTDRRILKCEYIRFLPSENSTINPPNFQMYIIIPREDSVIIFVNNYIEIIFDVLQATSGNRYADGNDMRLVNLGPIALYSNYKLTTSLGKFFKEITHPHIFSLMYKLLTTSKIAMICLLVSTVVVIEDNKS